jgi:signal transduction histidine kinase/DNA-binding LacI/PurR family transcriptional regulator
MAAARHPRTIGLITPYLEASFEPPFLQGVCDEARRRHARIIAFVGGQLKGENPANTRFSRAYDLVSSETLDGLLVTPRYMAKLLDDEELSRFLASFSPLPVVCVDRSVPGIPLVGADDGVAMYNMISHLVSHHRCRRIALLEAANRRQCLLHHYKEACTAFDLEYDPRLIVSPCSGYQEGAVQAISVLLDSRGVSFDGIITTGQFQMSGVLNALHSRDIHIGEQVALATFCTEVLDWPITMAVEPLQRVGAAAVRKCLSLIEGNPVAQQTTVAYTPPLIVRSSCGCDTASPHQQSICGSPQEGTAGGRSLRDTSSVEHPGPHRGSDSRGRPNAGDAGDVACDPQVANPAGKKTGRAGGLSRHRHTTGPHTAEASGHAGGDSAVIESAARCIRSTGMLDVYGHSLLRRVYETMKQSLRDCAKKPAFFDALRRFTAHLGPRNNKESVLTNAISQLHAYLCIYHATPATSTHALQLLRQAQDFIATELFSMEYSTDVIRAKRHHDHIHVYLQHISTATSIEELRAPLSKLLDTLGIRFLSLNVYDRDSHGAPLYTRARCILRFAGNRLESFFRTDSVFASCALFPDIGPAPAEDTHIAVLPLFGKQDLGFMTIELSTTHLRRLQAIREGLSLGLSTALLFEKLQRHSESLDKTNTQLKKEITQREKLRDMLIQSHKMEALGRVVNGVAHDFNNLLTIINGNCTYVAHSVADETLAKRISDAQSASHMAGELVAQLRGFSRTHENEQKQQVHDLNELIHNMQSLVKSSLGSTIALDIELCDHRSPVRVNTTELKQILLNLAVNARDAMPHGGTFSIRTRLRPGGDMQQQHMNAEVPTSCVLLEVSDTGTGMDEDTRKKAFEPFFTTKAQDKGTGMGLATVYGIIKRSHGAIRIHSIPGEGTRFSIYFPRQDDTPVQHEG